MYRHLAMLWLLGARGAPAEKVFAASHMGFDDPVTIAVAIHELFIEDNRIAIEAAYAKGDAACRAAIGETFYRHQTPMPWAEEVILRGLSDPDQNVQECFAKGSVVLAPPSSRLRARLEAMKNAKSECAAWALSIFDGQGS